MRRIAALLGLAVLSAPAAAEGLGVGAHGGLMGAGLNAHVRLSDALTARASYSRFERNYHSHEREVNYDSALDLNSVQAGVDWYPVSSGLRFSTALVDNRNELQLQALPSAGFLVLNDKLYAEAEVGELRGTVSYPDTGLYLGMGWDEPVAGGLSVIVDIGVYYLGEPEVSQRVGCGITARCAQLQADAGVERRRLEDDLARYAWWPQVQVGMAYRF